MRRLVGHFNYFGVNGNFRSLACLVAMAKRAWLLRGGEIIVSGAGARRGPDEAAVAGMRSEQAVKADEMGSRTGHQSGRAHGHLNGPGAHARAR